MKVKIFSDFCPPEGNISAVKSWGKGLKYKNIEFSADDDYTHAILINSVCPNLTVGPKNVLQLLWEPYELLNINSIASYCRKNCHNIIAHDKSVVGDVVSHWIPFLSPMPLDCNYIRPKKHKMSILASAKSFLPGHKLRHQLVDLILKSDLDIHIYGRGIDVIFKTNDPRLKGGIEDKSLALSEYQYTIAIENSMYDYYLTEKYTDPIICGSIPLYWGAKKVNDVYGNESHIDLPQVYDPNEIFESIKQIYNSEPQKDTNIVLNKIKEEINFPEFVWKTFNK